MRRIILVSFLVISVVVGIIISCNFRRGSPFEIKFVRKANWVKFKDDKPNYGQLIKFRDSDGNEKKGIFMKDTSCRRNVLLIPGDDGIKGEIIVTDNDEWRPTRERKSRNHWQYVRDR